MSSGNYGLAFATLVLAACGQSPEQIVTGTSHCTEVKVTPHLTMRLSRYYGYPDSIELWVVQACHPTGTACSPVLTYDHAPPPVYTVSGQDVTVSILGGRISSMHNERVKMGSRLYKFQPHVIAGEKGERGVRAFLSRVQHLCPAGNQPFPH